MNRLLTRGFGPKTTPVEEAGPITLGMGKANFGPPPPRLFIHHRIITRGFSKDSFPVLPGAAGPVVLGYGAIEHPPAPEADTNLIRARQRGQSGTKRRLERLESIIVRCKLIEVDDHEPEKPVQGWIRVKVDPNTGQAAAMAEHVGTRTRSPLEDIVISVDRIRKQ